MVDTTIDKRGLTSTGNDTTSSTLTVDINTDYKRGVTYSEGTTPVYKVKALTADTTLTAGGVYTVSSSEGGAKTITFPAPDTVPGAIFTIRNLSADSTVLTSSDASNNGFSFVGVSGSHSTTAHTSAQVTGKKVTINVGTTGGGAVVSLTSLCNAVTYYSDGFNYLQMGSSGSFIYAAS